MAELSLRDIVGAMTETVTDEDALDQWLQDGAWDIINRVQISSPIKLQSFAQQKDVSNNTAIVGDNLLLGVYSATSEYREIPAALKIKAVATDSIHASTLTNPVYWKENGNIYLRPTGGVSNVMSIVEIDSTNLIGSKKPSDIDYFPDRMKHLITMYAAMQQFQFVMKSKTVPLDNTLDLSSISTPVLPITFTSSSSASTWDGSAQSRVIIDNNTLAAVPTYDMPVSESRTSFKDYVSGIDHTGSDPGVLTVNISSPILPVLNDVVVDTSSWTQPTFVPPVMEFVDWSNTDDWIEIEEDPEMLAARVQEISAKSNHFVGALQESKMKFDKDNAIFQAEIQKSLQDAQLAGTKEANEVQRFTSEQADFQAKVGKEVSVYTQKLTRYSTELQAALAAWTKEESDKITRFQSDMQNNLNEFNEDNAEYQAKLQIAIENARLTSAGDGILMQRFANEIQRYQAEVASKVQEYTAKVQARGVEYQWLQEQYARLKAQYEQSFVPFAPPKEQK